MLNSSDLDQKSSEISIKTRSPPPSSPFKGPATQHTTVKWSFENAYFNSIGTLTTISKFLGVDKTMKD